MRIKRITIASYLLALTISALGANSTKQSVPGEIQMYSSDLCGISSSYSLIEIRELILDKLFEMSDPDTASYYADEILDSTSILDCFLILGLDSFNALEFTFWLEDEFGIEMQLHEFYQRMGYSLEVFCQYIQTSI